MPFALLSQNQAKRFLLTDMTLEKLTSKLTIVYQKGHAYPLKKFSLLIIVIQKCDTNHVG